MKRPYGSGQIYEKSGAFYGRWRTADGRRLNRRLGPKRTTGSAGGLTRAQAEQALRRIMGEEAAKQPRRDVVPESVTVDQTAELLRDRLAIEGARLSYRQNCESMQRVHISPVLGKRKVASVTTQDVERLARQMLAKGSSRKTVRNVMTFLHSVFALAFRNGWVSANPVVDAALEILKQLPPRLQRVAMLRALGFKQREIGEVTGDSETRVHVLARRANDKLSDLYEERLRREPPVSPRAGRLRELEAEQPEWLTSRIGNLPGHNRGDQAESVRRRAWRRAALALDDYRAALGVEDLPELPMTPRKIPRCGRSSTEHCEPSPNRIGAATLVERSGGEQGDHFAGRPPTAGMNLPTLEPIEYRGELVALVSPTEIYLISPSLRRRPRDDYDRRYVLFMHGRFPGEYSNQAAAVWAERAMRVQEQTADQTSA